MDKIKLFLIIVFSVVITSFGASSTTAVSGIYDGMLAYYPFENWGSNPCWGGNDWDNGGAFNWLIVTNEKDSCTNPYINDTLGFYHGYDGVPYNLGSYNWYNDKQGQSIRLNDVSSDEYIMIPDGDYIHSKENLTISFWAKPNDKPDITDRYYIIGKGCDNSSLGGRENVSLLITYNWVGHYDAQLFYNDQDDYVILDGSTVYNEDEWNHVAVVLNTSHAVLYVNNTIQDTASWTGRTIWDDGQNMTFGNLATPETGCVNIQGRKDYEFNGSIDDIRVYDWAFTSDNINTIYGSNNAPSWAMAYNMTARWNFDAEYQPHPAYTTIYDSAPWTYRNYGDNLFYDYMGFDKEHYIEIEDVTEIKQMCDTDGCSVCMWFNLEADATNQHLLGRYGESGADKFLRFWYSPSGNLWFTLDDNGATASGYQTVSYSILGNNLENEWVYACGVYDGSNTTAGNTYLYINGILRDTSDGTLTIDSNAWSDEENFRLGMVNLDSADNTFNGYLDDVVIFERSLSAGEVLTLYSSPIFNASVLNITFIDESDNTLVSGTTITLEAISGDMGYNYSTSTGYMEVSGLLPETYTLRYSASGYAQNFYEVDIVGADYTEITLYLIPDTGVSNVTAIVYDQINDELEGVLIQYLKYNTILGSYQLVGMATTNFEGQTVLPLELNTEYYIFMLYYQDVLKLTTNPTYIYEETITFQINTEETALEDYYSINDITSSCIFNNITNNFRLIYSDPNSQCTSYCLEVFEINALDVNISYNSSCLTTTSGTILVGVEAINGTTYTANAMCYHSEGSDWFNGADHEFTSNNPLGKLGLFLILILTFIIAFASRSKLWAFIVLTPIPTVIGSYLSIVPINKVVATGLMIACVIIALIVRDQ